MLHSLAGTGCVPLSLLSSIHASSVIPSIHPSIPVSLLLLLLLSSSSPPHPVLPQTILPTCHALLRRVAFKTPPCAQGVSRATWRRSGQRAPNPPEFAHPHLTRAGPPLGCPPRGGCEFRWVCSCKAKRRGREGVLHCQCNFLCVCVCVCFSVCVFWLTAKRTGRRFHHIVDMILALP